MDPQECLNRIQEALFARDFDEAEEHAENLETWILRGGFYPEPKTLKVPKVAPRLRNLRSLKDLGVLTLSSI